MESYNYTIDKSSNNSEKLRLEYAHMYKNSTS